MESPIVESKNLEVTINNMSTSSSSNQFIPDSLELPDDTFRMSLDNFSMVGENVTISREVSVDSSVAALNAETSTVELPTPVQTPDPQTPNPGPQTPQTPPPDNTNFQSITETPKSTETHAPIRRPQTLLQLSLSKKNDNDIFVKPSPVAELMSPAKMLQFELEATSATPTMKRAAIDFDFFAKHKFDEYFVDSQPKDDNETQDPGDGGTSKETPVIVKANTVRHEIGYATQRHGKLHGVQYYGF